MPSENSSSSTGSSNKFIFPLLAAILAIIGAYSYFSKSATSTETVAHSAISAVTTPLSNKMASTITKAPALFISHGGGPLPLLNVPDHQELAKFLREKAPSLLNLNGPNKPKALVVVTAHWETQVPTVSTRTNSKLFFDYYGFPKETYSYTYEARGSPEIGQLIADAIKQGGFPKVEVDSERGWDHGVFVPMKLIAPEGLDIPLIMLSVLKSQNAEQLIKLGKALAPLRDQGIAFLGSGTTFHNFDGIFAGPVEKKKFYSVSSKFENNLNEVLSGNRDGSDKEQIDSRLSLLEKWQSWPGASIVQPPGAQDHFSPLVVLAGTLAEKKANRNLLLDLSSLPASIWSF